MYVVNTDFKRPGKDLIERAADTFACIAGQAAGRRSVMDSGIRPLSRGWRLPDRRSRSSPRSARYADQPRCAEICQARRCSGGRRRWSD